MKPNLTFQTGRDYSVKPKDAVTGRTFNVQRTNNRENRRRAPPTLNTDDALVCNESGYDIFIKEKGINSSFPVLLGIIPARNKDEEQEIINIQRNLNIETMKSVSKIINSTTGSFNSQETNITATTPTREFTEIYNNVLKAYAPKAEFLSFIDDFFSMEMTDAPKLQIEVASESSTNFRGQRVKGTSISEYSSTKKWFESELLGFSYTTRLNVANMLQMLKNSLHALRYTEVGFFTRTPSANPVFSIDGLSFSDSYGNAGEVILNLYNQNIGIPASNFDSMTDQMLVILSKEALFSKVFTSFKIDDYINSIFGDLLDELRTQELKDKPSLGAFNDFVYREVDGKTVLNIDNILTSQEYLNSFDTADQFYLIHPISNNTNLLQSRYEVFNQIVNNITTRTGRFLTLLTANNQEAVVKTFLSTLCDFIRESILSKQTNTSTAALDEAKSISLLLKAREDKDLLELIIKILMYRDRLRNIDDYVSTEFRTEFIVTTRSNLVSSVKDLSRLYLGFEVDRDGNLTNQDGSAQTVVSMLNGSTIGKNADVVELARPWGSEESGTGGTSAWVDLYNSLLVTSKGMIWDTFFDGAKKVENYINAPDPQYDGNSFGSRAGTVVQFFETTRDHRALCFLMSTLRFFSTEVSGNRYDMSSWSSNDGSTYFYEFGNDWSYFTDLASNLDRISSQTFTIGTQVNVTNRVVLGEAQTLEDLYPYVSSILSKILQGSQNTIDSINYVNSYLNTTARLLKDAAQAAKDFTPKYGESLAALYTTNTITNLAKIKKSGFTGAYGFQKYTPYYFRTAAYTPGIIQYAQKVIPESEDSFTVICGIPYGMLERLGAYKLGVERAINVTITFRDIDEDSPTRYEITRNFPATSFIDPAKQEYSLESMSNASKFISDTNLYYLNQSGGLAVDNFTDIVTKSNELESTAILEYYRLLYGLDLDLESYPQASQINATALFPGLETAKTKVANSIAGLRLSDLIASRYLRTSERALMLSQQDIFQNGLGGCTFDKIIAIPVDGDKIRKDKNFYLCDVLIAVSLITLEEIQTATAEEITRSFATRSSRVSSTAAAIAGKVTSTSPGLSRNRNN